MTMNEIFVIGFGILIYDNDYNLDIPSPIDLHP